MSLIEKWCQNCRYFELHEDDSVGRCTYPIPEWLMSSLTAGYIGKEQGQNCTVWEGE